MTLDEFFAVYGESRRIFDAVHVVVAELGPVELAVSKSQVAFCRGKPFAWAWIPDQYLHGRPGRHAPLVLTLAFDHRDDSPRWKQIVQPTRRRFVHHLELWSIPEIDDEVRRWLQEAWNQAA